MQGCGNDYVYVNGFTEKLSPQEKPEIVRKLSDRHFGIGGDGVIFINPAEEADFEMEMYNADGSRSEMCGNGIRCVAKYVYDKGLTDREDITIVSAGKIKYLKLTVEGRTATDRGHVTTGTGEHGTAGPGTYGGTGDSGSDTADLGGTSCSGCTDHGGRRGIPYDLCLHGQSPCHCIYERGKGSRH